MSSGLGSGAPALRCRPLPAALHLQSLPPWGPHLCAPTPHVDGRIRDACTMRPCLSSLPAPKGVLEGAVTTITAHSDTTPDCSPGLNTLPPPTHPAAPRSTLSSLFYRPENRLERFQCLDSVSCAYTLVYCMSKLMVLKSGVTVPSYFFSH